MPRILFISLISVFVLLFSGCEDAPEAIPLAYPEGPVVFIGDGFGAGKGLEADELPFPDLIQERLAAMRTNKQAINLSAEGMTTREGLMLATAVIPEYKPSTLVIALGYTDMHLGSDPAQINQNLRAIAKTGRQNAVRVIICGFGSSPIYRNIQRDAGAIIVPDYLRGVKGDPTYTSSRAPYPNREGHELIRETLWSVMQNEIFVPFL